MDLVTGMYKFECNENFLEYLLAVGVPDDYASVAAFERPTVEFKREDNKIHLISTSKFPNSSNTFVLNEEITEETPIGTLTTFTKLEDNTITATFTVGGVSGMKVYKFDDDSLEVTLNSTNPNIPTARRLYRRIKP
ncbi:fatty acid binding protein 1-A, liver-like [Aethina tumida]|uniref:fatty acid binding protein 1-A, liver-like n=1 Tax=Aethina tumida TaxID=116153 RepID=UPI00096AFDF2|nr:fatty acid binding protein 1-A, liver-like [Aethina tumida]